MIRQRLLGFFQHALSRERRYAVATVGVLVVIVAAGLIFARGDASAGNVAAASLASPTEATGQQIAAGSYRWSYAAKFVCGYQPDIKPTPGTAFTEPVVKPGNYATEINIHNPNYKELPLNKKLIVLVKGQEVLAREPQSVGPLKKFNMVLGPDFATMDDCNNLWRLLDSPMPPPPASSLTVGYLVILSPLELDVDVVYSAEVPGGVDSTGQMPGPTGISVDVERVTGKRVFVPAGLP